MYHMRIILFLRIKMKYDMYNVRMYTTKKYFIRMTSVSVKKDTHTPVNMYTWNTTKRRFLISFYTQFLLSYVINILLTNISLLTIHFLQRCIQIPWISLRHLNFYPYNCFRLLLLLLCS